MTLTNVFRNSALRWLVPLVGLGLLVSPGPVAADFVIPDDLIVQGSACIGLDCVDGENFGFDTIRLKENNTRIQFDDTSVGSFPTNNWQIRANSSAGGGQSFLGFVDQGASGNSETGTVVFQVNAGAPANALFVDGTGRVGFRTATPVLDLHVNTSNTPAMRLEQNNSNGFTAQTWDVGANEANFFVRDVTGGSKLSFRIRPGAPTSSLDISSSGKVGINTGSPDSTAQMTVAASDAALTNGVFIDARGALVTNALLGKRVDANPLFLRLETTNGTFRCGVQGNGEVQFGGLTAGDNLNLVAGGSGKMAINTSGQVSFGNLPPAIGAHALIHESGAHLTIGGAWTNASSRALKQDIEPITSEQARDTVRALHPVGYRYKSELDERYVGFIAEDVPDLVATKDRKGLGSMDITAVLTKVVQDQEQMLENERKLNADQQQVIAQQQKLLEALSRRLQALEQKTSAVTETSAVSAGSK